MIGLFDNGRKHVRVRRVASVRVLVSALVLCLIVRRLLVALTVTVAERHRAAIALMVRMRLLVSTRWHQWPVSSIWRRTILDAHER